MCKRAMQGAPLRQAARTSLLVLRSLNALLAECPAKPCAPQLEMHHPSGTNILDAKER